MGKVVTHMSMSLDGCIAGLNPTREQPLGKGGTRLHEWIFGDKTGQHNRVLEEIRETPGAVIVGNRTYTDAIDGAWNGVSPFNAPAFVLATQVPDHAAEGFSFVTDGIESALVQARKTAGDKNVWVMGGANVIQQYLNAGLLDELQIHLIPVILGEGIRLFDPLNSNFIELEHTRVLESTGVIHLNYRIVR